MNPRLCGQFRNAVSRRTVPSAPCRFALLLLIAAAHSPGQIAPTNPQTPPEVPSPVVHEKTSTERCLIFHSGAISGILASVVAVQSAGVNLKPPDALPSCPSRIPLINWYSRFITGPQVKPMTPKEKAWLAVRNVGDPFNIMTILGESAISVAANAHSPYGPGFMGWGRYAGDSFTQDATGEFFGTFLIPTLVHQDPHYHRMAVGSIKRRALHAFTQVEWTQGDNGRGMPNYGSLLGFAIDDEIANLYVPGRETNGRATAERYGIGLLTAPIDNYVAEFLPDIASHIHIQVVVIQRIINHVATTTASSTSP